MYPPNPYKKFSVLDFVQGDYEGDYESWPMSYDTPTSKFWALVSSSSYLLISSPMGSTFVLVRSIFTLQMQLMQG